MCLHSKPTYLLIYINVYKGHTDASIRRWIASHDKGKYIGFKKEKSKIIFITKKKQTTYFWTSGE